MQIEMLLDAIGAGSFNPSSPGPVVVQIKLWDGRTVEGTYHRCEEDELDVVERNADIILKSDELRPFVEKLVANNTSFVTEVGSHDMMCTLRWTMRELAP